jgi:NAD(P)-dependent dehydrogenase (short-subunit alcohol dehydrogenase family)
MIHQKSTVKLRDLFGLKGRVAVVTGGAGLLGVQFAEALAEFGAVVIVADINQAKAQSAAKAITKVFTTRVAAREVNLESQISVKNLMKSVAREFSRIDILVNAAQALPEGNNMAFEKTSLAVWDKVLRVNLTGTYLCCQAVLPYMLERKSGSIINMGSTYGIVGACQEIYADSGINSPGHYAATKSGIIHFTKYLAAYLAGRGIRVNSISPGGVFNQQHPTFVKNYAARTPLKRMARPHEMKGAVLYLASDASSYATGHNLVVDGGWTIW